VTYGRFSADQLQKLREMKFNHDNRGGVVTVTEMPSDRADPGKTSENQQSSAGLARRVSVPG
jgi:hypothetical protein